MTQTSVDQDEKVFEHIRGVRDALTVRRVFGDAYQVDDCTVIPVARVMGGAGGGGGQGNREGESGAGYGTGFGLQAKPIGVYQVRNGEVVWKPAIDAARLAQGGQILAGIFLVCATLVAIARLTR